MAGFAAARGYPDTPENHLPVDLNALFPDHLRCAKQPDYTVALSPFSRPPPSLRLPIRSHLHNQPAYVTLGLVATSILILIVARFSP